MTNPSADPVPAITEAEATGNIAAIYTDIRATLGVPVVNLIWRHLAVFPDGLPWAWESLKPLYASGAIAGQAAALRAGLEVPVLPALSGPALPIRFSTADFLPLRPGRPTVSPFPASSPVPAPGRLSLCRQAAW